MVGATLLTDKRITILLAKVRNRPWPKWRFPLIQIAIEKLLKNESKNIEIFDNIKLDDISKVNTKVQKIPKNSK